MRPQPTSLTSDGPFGGESWLTGFWGPGKQTIMAKPIGQSPPRGGTIERSAPQASLSLLGAFQLTWDGDLVSLPVPAQRLLAFVALRDRPVLRSYAAETLWLESTTDHACGSLRSALWRLRRPGYELIDVSSGRLRLEPRVVVDVRVLDAWAHGALGASDSVGEPPAVSDPGAAALDDLLPDWYDEWLVLERERLRELRVRALERVCERLTAIGSFGQAIEAGLAAVLGRHHRRVEPRRGSSRQDRASTRGFHRTGCDCDREHTGAGGARSVARSARRGRRRNPPTNRP